LFIDLQFSPFFDIPVLHSHFVIAQLMVGEETGIDATETNQETFWIRFSYHQSMTSLDKDGLNELNRNFTDEYSKGKINNEQYTNLKKEISASI
jgi:hypothetical protein